MFGSDNHVSSTEKSVASGRIYAELVSFGGGKVYFSALRLTYPVNLLCFYTLNKIKSFKTGNKSVGILGDFEHPLTLYLSYNGRPATLANAANDLFVSKNDLTGRAEVYCHFLFISETFLEKLKENPLRPLVVRGICGVYFTRPIEGKTKRLKL